MVEEHPDHLPLLWALEIVDLPTSTWYDRQKQDSGGREDEEEKVKQPLEEIIQDNPGYGYRRMKPEFEERTGEVINHKRLLRLLDDTNLALLRTAGQAGPASDQAGA